MKSISINNLKESNEFLNAILDNINSAVFIVDENVRVQKFNNSFEKLFETDEELALGKLCGNTIGCAYAIDENVDCGYSSYCSKCELRSSMIRTLTKKVPTSKHILHRDFHIGPKRITKYFQYTTRYINFDNKKMIVVIVDDHSELIDQKSKLELQNQELSNLNNQKNEFLGIAAHDLRNPIGGIISFTELLLDSFSDFPKEEIEEFLKIIKESGKFSLALLDDLLNIAKIESGKIALKKEPIDIRNFLTMNIEKNKVFAKNKNIDLKLSNGYNSCKVQFDKNKIEQVMNNFISNAIKYSFPETSIEVQVIPLGSNIEIHIKDQGQGIPENELNLVFKAFEKTSVQTTASETSTGLGLAITKKIIEEHGGKVGVKSEVGTGSDFYFSLPLN